MVKCRITKKALRDKSPGNLCHSYASLTAEEEAGRARAFRPKVHCWSQTQDTLLPGVLTFWTSAQTTRAHQSISRHSAGGVWSPVWTWLPISCTAWTRSFKRTKIRAELITPEVQQPPQTWCFAVTQAARQLNTWPAGKMHTLNPTRRGSSPPDQLTWRQASRCL